MPALAAALAAAGLGSLRLDFPGNGESPGTFRYANMRDEVRAGAAWLRAGAEGSAGAYYRLEKSIAQSNVAVSGLSKAWAAISVASYTCV